MMHRAGVVALLTTDRHGLLEVRLLDYAEGTSDWIEYPKKKVQYGARAAQAAWAEDAGGEPTGLLLCWATGREMQADGPSEFICAQRRPEWLREPEGLEFGSKLAMVVILALVCFFCCFKQCTQHGTPARRPARRLELAGAGRRRSSRAARTLAEQSRLRELRVQLADIPSEPPRVPPSAQPEASAPPPEESPGSSADVPRRAESARSWGDVCGICQEDVVVRVALQRCGHTTCRDCARRLLDMNRKCHVCRGDIEASCPSTSDSSPHISSPVQPVSWDSVPLLDAPLLSFLPRCLKYDSRSCMLAQIVVLDLFCILRDLDRRVATSAFSIRLRVFL